MRDYTSRAALTCVLVIAVLIGTSFIPGQSLMGVELRRANILSDILSFSDDAESLLESGEELQLDETDYYVDLESVSRSVEQAVASAVSAEQSVDASLEVSIDWDDDQLDDNNYQSAPSKDKFKRLLADVELTPIEDFDTTGCSPMQRLYSKLVSPDSLVRIAFMGDSFVEGDILTSHLREALHDNFAGCAPGYAPMSSPLTNFRQTIKTQSKGWDSYNVMQRRKAPESVASEFYVSGWVSKPAAKGEASVEWRMNPARRHVDSCQVARLLFKCRTASVLRIAVNEQPARDYTFTADSATVRQVVLSARHIESLKMEVVSGAAGFIGYGAIFEGGVKGSSRGVVLDNYSVRSNNGQAMFWTNPSTNAQVDRLIGGYDLVVLQYGLNIMQKGIMRYSNYEAQIEKMISFARECFPRSAILVLGVSDRSMKSGSGEYQPMVEAPEMIKYQREAAHNMGAAFWSTYDAMQARGGMAAFVANGWAGKDFTHINFNGGEQVAHALYDAIATAVQEYLDAQIVVRRLEPLVSTEQDQMVVRELEVRDIRTDVEW